MSSHLESIALTMLSISEKILEVKESLSDNLLQSIESSLISPIYLNISQLSSQITSLSDSLEIKMSHSIHDLASRTLTSIRNLSSTFHSELNSTIQQFHDFKSLTELNYILLQNELKDELHEGKKQLEQKFEFEKNSTLNIVNELQNNTIPFIVFDLKNWTHSLIYETKHRFVYPFQ